MEECQTNLSLEYNPLQDDGTLSMLTDPVNEVLPATPLIPVTGPDSINHPSDIYHHLPLSQDSTPNVSNTSLLSTTTQSWSHRISLNLIQGCTQLRGGTYPPPLETLPLAMSTPNQSDFANTDSDTSPFPTTPTVIKTTHASSSRQQQASACYCSRL